METKRKALGKGLEQLFSNEVINFENYTKEEHSESSDLGVKSIKLEEIRSNPYQPRKKFDEDTLRELSDSIKEHGIIEPVLVKKSIKGYELVAGERRCKAARLAGLTEIQAIVKDYNDQQMMEVALLENIQREDLNPIEEATAIQNIIHYASMTQEDFAKKFGKSRSHVTNILGLLTLPEITKQYVLDKKISMGHARALSKIKDEAKINELAERIINESMSVRGLENLINEENLPKRQKQERATKTQNIRNSIYESLLREKLGVKVKVTDKKIEIPYTKEEDLGAILEMLGVRIEGV